MSPTSCQTAPPRIRVSKYMDVAGFLQALFLRSCEKNRTGFVIGTRWRWRQPFVGGASAAMGGIRGLARCRGIAAEAAPTETAPTHAAPTVTAPTESAPFRMSA